MIFDDFEEVLIEIGSEVVLSEKVELTKDADVTPQKIGVGSPSSSRVVTKSVTYDVSITSKQPVDVSSFCGDKGSQIGDVKLTGITEPQFVILKNCVATASSFPKTQEIRMIAEDMVIEAPY